MVIITTTITAGCLELTATTIPAGCLVIVIITIITMEKDYLVTINKISNLIIIKM